MGGFMEGAGFADFQIKIHEDGGHAAVSRNDKTHVYALPSQGARVYHDRSISTPVFPGKGESRYDGVSVLCIEYQGVKIKVVPKCGGVNILVGENGLIT